MEARPVGVTDDQVQRALQTGWQIDATGLDYVPLGFGSYHWAATDRAGTRWFVTVDDLDGDAPDRTQQLDELAHAFTAARALYESGLSFVVAPVPAVAGESVRRLADRYSIAVFPRLDGRTGEFGVALEQPDRTDLIDVLAALHDAAAHARAAAPRLGFGPIGRSTARIEAALAESGRPWAGGPFAEPARAWLLDHEAGVRSAIDAAHRLMAELGNDAAQSVVTHGEPHPGNVMRTDAGLRLIDWDTVGLARPERDLWFLADDPHALERYSLLTGRTVDPRAIQLYRDAWTLADLAVFLSDFRAPHISDEDTNHSWRNLNRIEWRGDR